MLSLVFVPAVFTVMDDIGHFAWRIFSRFVGDTDDPVPAKPQPHEPQQWPMAAE